MVIEGVHLVPGYIDARQFEDARVVQLVIARRRRGVAPEPLLHPRGPDRRHAAAREVPDELRRASGCSAATSRTWRGSTGSRSSTATSSTGRWPTCSSTWSPRRSRTTRRHRPAGRTRDEEERRREVLPGHGGHRRDRGGGELGRALGRHHQPDAVLARRRQARRLPRPRQAHLRHRRRARLGETVGLKRDEIVREGEELAAIAPNVVVKVPMMPEGLAATKTLHEQGHQGQHDAVLHGAAGDARRARRRRVRLPVRRPLRRHLRGRHRAARRRRQAL